MSNKWFEEIMTLKISNLPMKDITKLLIIYYCLEKDLFNNENKIEDFNKFAYRFYIDNPDIAILNPSSIIRNIEKYGPKDIINITYQALNEWNSDVENSSLFYNNIIFKIIIDNYNEYIKKMTKQIADMLFEKSLGIHYHYNDELFELKDISEYDLDLLNKTRLKNRVLENNQYCSCCDSTDKLNIVNISNDKKFILENGNYYLLCKRHYDLYKSNYFDFKQNGFILIKKNSCDLDQRMHLSNSIMKISRKYFNEKN